MIININKSVILTATIGVAHLGAVVAASLSGLDALPIAILCLPIGLSLILSLRAHVYRTAKAAITTLVFEATGDGSYRIFPGSELEGIGCLVRTLFVTRFGVVLTVACEDRLRSRALVIAADAVGRETFRQLRVRLKIAPPVA